MNALEQIMLEFPDKPWSVRDLSWNPKLTYRMLKTFPNHDWNYYPLRTNKNITLENILEFCSISSRARNHIRDIYDWHAASRKVTPNQLVEHYHFPWDWNHISTRVFKEPGWDLEFVNNNLELKWNWDVLSNTIPLEVIKSAYLNDTDKFSKLNRYWVWDRISFRQDLTSDFVTSMINAPWAWDRLLKNPVIKWDLDVLAEVAHEQNRQVIWDIIKSPGLDLENISRSKFFKLLLTHENNVDWEWLSVNVPGRIIRDNPNRPWVWREVSGNPNIGIELLKENFNRDWDWGKLSRNPFNGTRVPWNYGKGFALLNAKLQSQVILVGWVCKIQELPPELMHMIIEYFLDL